MYQRSRGSQRYQRHTLHLKMWKGHILEECFPAVKIWSAVHSLTWLFNRSSQTPGRMFACASTRIKDAFANHLHQRSSIWKCCPMWRNNPKSWKYWKYNGMLKWHRKQPRTMPGWGWLFWKLYFWLYSALLIKRTNLCVAESFIIFPDSFEITTKGNIGIDLTTASLSKDQILNFA